jgi:hypothetical protein
MASLSGAGGSQIYRYDILNRGKWIRLLRLLPGRDDDTLSCELFSADIRSNLKYSAISYVWEMPLNASGTRQTRGLSGPTQFASIKPTTLSVRARLLL